MARFKPEDFPEGHPMHERVKAMMSASTTDGGRQTRRIRQHPEEDLQREIIKTADGWPLRTILKDGSWPDWVRRKTVGDWLFHVPNQRGDAVQRGVLSAMGVRSGVWDLFLTLPIMAWGGDASRVIPGLYLEVKAGKGHLSHDQTTFGEKVRGAGYLTRVVRSSQDFQRHIEEYLGESFAPTCVAWQPGEQTNGESP